jgi:hypothetical protein
MEKETEKLDMNICNLKERIPRITLEEYLFDTITKKMRMKGRYV